MELRKINEICPAVNSIGRPVEIGSLPGGLTLDKVQVSLDVICLPGTSMCVLAHDFAAMLSCLLSGNDIITPNDPAVRSYLLGNLCMPSHDQRKIRLRPEKAHMATGIIEQIAYLKEEKT